MSQAKLSKTIEPYLDTILFTLQNNFQIISTECIQSFDNPKKGFVESFFYKKILKRYHSYVKRDIKVGPYFPDLALIINDICYIDIEIDEPYSFVEDIPIHYIGSSDLERDTFFTEVGWYVVRFSEFQIKNNYEDCIALIENLVNFTLTKKVIYLNNLNDIRESIKSPKWTYEEAEEMIKENWRETYL